MEDTRSDWFSSRTEKLLSACKGKTLLFFRGFARPQVSYLMQHGETLLPGLAFSEEEGLNVPALIARQDELLEAAKAADGPRLGIYEELLVLRDRLGELEDFHILVAENELLAPWQPSLLQTEDALALFDLLQGEQEPDTELLQGLSDFYGKVKLLGNGEALLLPAPVESENVKTVSFFDTEMAGETEKAGLRTVALGSTADWRYRLSLLRGEREGALLLRTGREDPDVLCGLERALTALSVPYAFDGAVRHSDHRALTETDFLPLLHRWWGEDAAFRPLRFYRNGELLHGQEEISQGEIIAEIAGECEAAREGRDYSSIFITAPTGSGKSILFQLPALYLAEKHGLVTIVVSPLIALMNDQVEQLRQEHGMTLAACINSSMSFQERLETVEKIQHGEISLVYLAPELLLTTELKSFLGGRQVGLFVIDEAHTVTSWGRDFRSDYWFLGDFLKKCRREGMRFPVLCLTATAVYSGRDDVVNDTVTELGLDRVRIHLGNVKRDNIDFDITLHRDERIEGGLESYKMKLALERIRGYIAKDEKVLAYFPYRSQVDSIYALVPVAERKKLRRYHSQTPNTERKETELSYKSGEAMGLVCTKAFGMGVDVGDIRHVLHFAPTGTLSDYVQEIGRAGRSESIRALASIDYFPSDMRYVRALNGISEMRQYQLREMLKKLNAIVEDRGQRSFTVAADAFEYLFHDKEVENRTKAGLMLLAKDLEARYRFPVLVVRPRAMLSRAYVFVPREIDGEFLRRYGDYAVRMDGDSSRVMSAGGERGGAEVHIFSLGDTYLVDMAALWQNCFSHMAYGMFHRSFFEEELIGGGRKFHTAARIRVQLSYLESFEDVLARAQQVLDALVKLFSRHKNGAVRQFTMRELEAELEELLGEKAVAHDKFGLLMDIFTESGDESVGGFSRARSQVRVLRRRRMPGSEESCYFVSNNAYVKLGSYLLDNLKQCAPNAPERRYVRFYPVNQNHSIALMPLLRFLELLGLALYQIDGGEKSEVFVRVNDPRILRQLTGEHYRNRLLRRIQDRHRSGEALLEAFFNAPMSNEERWELIERYFLGDEAYVKETLGLKEEEQGGDNHG